ncbi:glycosyltransferase family protein [Fibrella forsythiae]|uniref:Glycosyl transferase n=1 Tax=Fibrella forsythiae TaxID=2817061 RepID=A0ABS3JE44_9BACT|nr:glycosyltransferase family protein [Fibrella forsythiae]MBO0948276.1 glycosyl transferase [Fibrella forsythiae]
MRFLFVIQGEGRGHLTQAISLAQILQAAGHSVVRAMVGLADRRPIPAFFAEQFPAPYTPLTTPELVYCPTTNCLNLGATLRRAVTQLGTFRSSMRQLNQVIEQERPDVVINFFELLCGLTYAFHKPAVPVISVAHQFMALHPDFLFPAKKRLDKASFLALVRLNAIGSSELLGLSFDQQSDVPERRLRVVPPLLRSEVMTLKPTNESFFLAYTTQAGLRSVVYGAHHQQPGQSLRYYHAGVGNPEEQVDDTLTECKLDGQRYLTDMARCNAVITTAGFESVCEAMYLGKPVLMMPQPNHYEQACNALDGQRAGAGIASDTFDLPRLIGYLSEHDTKANKRFRQWQSRVSGLFLASLSRAANPQKTGQSQRTGRVQTA